MAAPDLLTTPSGIFTLWDSGHAGGTNVVLVHGFTCGPEDWGALDDSLPRALQREIALGVPQSRLYVIPETGHLPTIESEQIVTDLLRAFL